MLWNVAGELVSPKNITVGSHSPAAWFLVAGVLNAAFHSSPSLIRTLLYPHRTSNFVKYFESLTLSINSEIRGSGYVFRIVCSLSDR